MQNQNISLKSTSRQIEKCFELELNIKAEDFLNRPNDISKVTCTEILGHKIFIHAIKVNVPNLPPSNPRGGSQLFVSMIVLNGNSLELDAPEFRINRRQFQSHVWVDVNKAGATVELDEAGNPMKMIFHSHEMICNQEAVGKKTSCINTRMF